MKDIVLAMLQQIHEKLKEYRLREGFKTEADFKVSKVVNPASINLWSNKTNKQLFKAAQKGDKTALEYLFYKMEPAIQGAFWRSYLGPSNSIRSYRIKHEDAWEQWLGIAWMAMTEGFAEQYNVKYSGGDAYTGEIEKEYRAKGALKSYDGKMEFNPDKLPEEKLMNVFAGRYKQILHNAAKNVNVSQKSGGISGREVTGGSAGGDSGLLSVHQYEPTWVEGKDDAGDDEIATSKGHKDNTFEEMYEDAFKDSDDKMENDSFLKRWKEFAQDPALRQNTKGVTVADVFFEAIDNPNAEMRAMGTKLGIARNSISTLLHKAHEILGTHNISGSELMNAIKYNGNDVVASYLKYADTDVEDKPAMDDNSPAEKTQNANNPSTKRIQKSVQNADFTEQFKQAFYDNKMWVPHKQGADAANLILWWINDDYPTNNELASEYQLKQKDVDYWMRRAWGTLKKYGVSEQDIKDAVNQHGKKVITDLIGEDDPDHWT